MHDRKKKGIEKRFRARMRKIFGALVLSCCLWGCGVCALSRVSAAAQTTTQMTTQTNEQGNFTNLIVFARFSGDEEFIYASDDGAPSVLEIVENCYTKAEYSVFDYYERVSSGKVRMQNLYLFTADGGSLTLSHTRGYYCTQDDSNTEGYLSSEYGARMYELKKDWSDAIGAALQIGAKITNADRTRTYDLQDLDKNGDGYLDSLTIVYPYSNRYSVSWSDCLWNYQDYYTGVTFCEGANTITSGAYLQFTANFKYLYSDANGVPFVSLKTMIHETGHIFGLKDLYRSETNSRVYYMSAMSNAISPVPQYISLKEREALGWLNDGNLRKIDAEGTYTLYATCDTGTQDTIGYTLDLASVNKSLYLEYRNFSGNVNKYDRQAKDVYNASGDKIRPLSLKSGLVCFLVDKDTKFPSNLYTSGSHWNYEVIGGRYATKSDAALAEGDSLAITASLSVEVLSLEEGKLTFKLSGTDFEKAHVHVASKTEYKASTCKSYGNIEYWHCSDCDRYFSDALLQCEIQKSDTALPLGTHTKETVKGTQPTCTSKGWTDGEKCSVCQEVLVERREIAKSPHLASDWIVDKAATPTENGRIHTECLDCKTVLERKDIFYQGNLGEDGKEDNDSSSSSSEEQPPIEDNDSSSSSSEEQPPIEDNDSSSSSSEEQPQNGCGSSVAGQGVWLPLTILGVALWRKKKNAARTDEGNSEIIL